MVMKTSMIIILLLMLSVWSCRDTPVNPNANNKVQLKYKGNTYNFANVTIEESFLELDAGLGLRAYGETDLDYDAPGQCCNYYVFLDFKKVQGNRFKPHTINFGINEKMGGNFLRKVYSASLTAGFNSTNFQMDISQRAPNIDGTFNGKLKDITGKEFIEITDGNYSFDLTTVKPFYPR
jgi:YHS domain-containing protein